MNKGFYEELEDTINDWWDSLPDKVKEAINKINIPLDEHKYSFPLQDRIQIELEKIKENNYER